MNSNSNASRLSDALPAIESRRANFQRALSLTYGLDVRVEITVHASTEPRAQELVDAARELGWFSITLPKIADLPTCYDHAHLSPRPSEGITLYGPDRLRRDA